MITIKILVNGRTRETIDIRYIAEPSTEPVSVKYEEKDFNKVDFEGEYEYLVNETYKIKHRRKDGHRELARKALEAIKIAA